MRLLWAYFLALVLVFSSGFPLTGFSLQTAVFGTLFVTALFMLLPLRFIEIKAPNIGLLWRFGRVAGVLPSGWYFIFSPLEKIEEVTMQPVIIEDRGTRLSGSFSPIHVSWQAVVAIDPSQVTEYIVSRDITAAAVYSAVWSSITAAAGRLRIDHWQEQTAFLRLQQETEEDVRRKLPRLGLKLESLQIVDAKDTLAEEAQAIRVRGKIEAERYGELVRKMEPARGDWAHAVAFIGAAFAQAFREAYGSK